MVITSVVTFERSLVLLEMSLMSLISCELESEYNEQSSVAYENRESTSRLSSASLLLAILDDCETSFVFASDDAADAEVSDLVRV